MKYEIGNMYIFNEMGANKNGVLSFLDSVDNSSSYKYKNSYGTACKYIQESNTVISIDDQAIHITDARYDKETNIVSFNTSLDPTRLSYTINDYSNSRHEGQLLTADITSEVEKHIEYIKKVNADIMVQRNKVKEKANSFNEVSINETTHYEEIIPDGNTLQDKFTSLVSKTSEISTKINSQIALGDTKELAKAFNDARESLRDVSNSSVSGPGRFAKTIHGLLDNKWTESLVKKADKSFSNASSVQDNIDYLFGLIHTKFEKLVEVGEGLQLSKSQFLAEVIALEKLVIESDKELDQYDATDKPMTMIALNSQIKAAVEKNKSKLSKIDGAILAVQATIINLGKNLPAHKSDLEDEMAIGGLLSSVGDYQAMYKEITDLVASTTKATAEGTHNVIENLMDLQINDTHTVKYLEQSVQRGEKFAGMLADKSKKLSEKIQRDAQFIGQIASGSTVIEAKKKYPLLD